VFLRYSALNHARFSSRWATLRLDASKSPVRSRCAIQSKRWFVTRDGHLDVVHADKDNVTAIAYWAQDAFSFLAMGSYPYASRFLVVRPLDLIADF
jgi:hypothetical protein